jgi:hypothetical protein
MKNARTDAGAKKRPSGLVLALKNPMAKEPVTLMTSVPSGKVEPNLVEAIRPESQKRETPPIALPSATQKYKSRKKSYRSPLICGFSVGVISSETVRRFTLKRVGKLHCHHFYRKYGLKRKVLCSMKSLNRWRKIRSTPRSNRRLFSYYLRPFAVVSFS